MTAPQTSWLIELINPLTTTNVTFNRALGTFSGVGAGNLTTASYLMDACGLARSMT